MTDREILLRIVEEKKDEYKRMRRLFHRIPELGMEENETTEEICRILNAYAIRPQRLAPTGVVAYIGEEKNCTIALRADIDGLSVTEETGLSFASVHPGKMHACGHDGHIAGLLGAAAVLKEMEKALPVRVKLIFQPSEENTQGASHILKQGVLDDVDYIFGLHLFSDMKRGEISVEPGPRMAQTDRFSVTFKGKGGHAGKPHQCVDAVVMAAEFVLSAQSIVSREIDPAQGAVVTIGSFHGGSQYNVIAQEAVAEGTCRSLQEDVARRLQEAVERRAKHIAAGYGGETFVEYHYGAHPPVINDAHFSRAVCAEAEKLLDRKFVHIPPLMLGEDFSWYQKRIPGVFAFVGCGKEKGCSYPNHHPCFDLDEDALIDAVCLHLAAVFAVGEHRKHKEKMQSPGKDTR